MISTAMILAAGRGERLRPITDVIPKPLVEVGGMPLILHHIHKLRVCGIRRIVINTAWLGHKLVEALNDGSSLGVEILWSHEPPGGLETAGGLRQALPLLGDEPFLVVNGDTYIDGNYQHLVEYKLSDLAAHLWLTANPSHHPQGDFSIRDGMVFSQPGLTFSGAAIYHPKFIAQIEPGRSPLKPWLLGWMDQNLISGSVLDGKWFDVGTVERLQEVNDYVREHLPNYLT